MKTLKFEKEINNDWFIVLPNYPGPKEDLQMVCGADTFLDILAQGEEVVRCVVDDIPFTGFKYCVTKYMDTPEIGGALYDLESKLGIELQMWLCDVTRFVFNGILPEKIYFS